MDEEKKIVLIFDGYCGVCTRMVQWLKRVDKHNRIAVYAWQEPGILDKYKLSREEANTAAWFFGQEKVPGNKRYRGAGAINAVLSVTYGTDLFSWFYNLPIIRQIQDKIYEWFAANRYRFKGVTPYCFEHDCGEETAASCRVPPR